MIRILATTTQLKGSEKLDEECNLVLGVKKTRRIISSLKTGEIKVRFMVRKYKYNSKADSLLSIQRRGGQSNPVTGLTGRI